MPELQAQRRLVKSPPELWAEVSDAASLARHLGEVGEITVTRVEPESTVAWEGERASGTVRLEPAGWGTRVTLTAQPSDGAEPSAAEPAPEATAAPEPAPKTPAPAPEPSAAEPAPEATAAPEPAPEPPAPAAEPPAADPQAPVRPSLLRRLFARRVPEPVVAAGAHEPSQPAAAEPSTPVAAVPAPEPPVAEPSPPAAPAGETPAAAEPAPSAPDATGDGLQAALTAALDSLGAAHHRPFSRG